MGVTANYRYRLHEDEFAISVEYPVNLPSESLNSAKVLCLGRCQQPLL